MAEHRAEEEDDWRELVRTNDPVLVSAVQALLNAAYIPHLLLDQNMSVLEGSIGILPRRMMVAEGYAEAMGLSGPKSLEEEIAELKAADKVDAELEELKAALATTP